MWSALALIFVSYGANPALSRPAGVPVQGLTIAGFASVGVRASDYAASLNPDVSYDGGRWKLSLGAPLWWTAPNADPTLVTLGNDFSRATSWAALIRRVRWVSRSEKFSLLVGRQRRLTLGKGVLVDDFRNALDPLTPQSGAETRWIGETISSHLVVDRIASPRLVAGRFAWHPATMLGRHTEQRLRIAAEFAIDPNAPTVQGGRVRGAGAAGAEFVVWQSSAERITLYSTAVAQDRDRWGGHFGFSFESGSKRYDGWQGVVVQAEAVRSGRDYQPVFAGPRYVHERSLRAPAGAVADRSLGRGGQGARLKASVRLQDVTFGGRLLVRTMRDPANLVLFAKVHLPGLSAAAFVSHRGNLRELGEPGHILALGEVSLTLKRGLYVFGQVYNGPRLQEGRERMGFDALAGLGFSLASSR